MDLTTHLRDCLSDDDHGSALCVAYSGGADSTALLHALAKMPQARERGLRAVHVDHGLHPESAQWAQHCIRYCATLDVALSVHRVDVKNTRSEGMEAAARRARQAAFAQSMNEGEYLVLAHHRDDQIETVLLKLLRGAGPEGLGGMRVLRSFSQGFLWRPLLGVPRSVLREYIQQQHLAFIDDPCNDDPRYSRNFLRHEVLPRIAAHWPQAAASILRSATLCRNAAHEIDKLVMESLAHLHRDDNTLHARGWSALPDALREPVLERWLHALGLPAPTQAQVGELKRQIDTARIDCVTCVGWRGAEVHLWRGALHALAPLPALPADWEAVWSGAPLTVPANCGTLSLRNIPSDTAGSSLVLNPPLTVRMRRGGERIKPAGDAHTRELRDLLQRAAIPPWQRARMPLIFSESDLLAVGDTWISDRGRALFEAHSVRLVWQRAGD